MTDGIGQLQSTFSRLSEDYRVLEEDLALVESLDDVVYFLDSNECYRYVFFDLPNQDISYTRKDKSATLLALEECVFQEMLFQDPPRSAFLPGHEKEFLNLHRHRLQAKLKNLAQVIDLSTKVLERHRGELDRVWKKISSMSENGGSGDLHEILATLMDVAPSLVLFLLKDARKPRRRLAHLYEHIKIHDLDAVMKLPDELDSKYQNIAEEARSAFFSIRGDRKYFGANYIDSQAFAYLAYLNDNSDESTLYRFVTRVPTFWRVAERLEDAEKGAASGYPFKSMIRHPRIFLSLVYSRQGREDWSEHVRFSANEFKQGEQRFKEFESFDSDFMLDSYYTKTEVRRLEDLIEKYQRVILSSNLAYLDNNEKTVLDATQSNLDIKRLYSLVGNSESLREAVVEEAFDVVDAISSEYYHFSFDVIAQAEINRRQEDYAELRFKAQPGTNADSAGLYGTEYLSVNDVIVPFALHVQNKRAIDALAQRNRKLKKYSKRLRQSFKKSETTFAEQWLVFAYIFAALDNWSLANKSCEAALHAAKKQGQVDVAHEIRFFGAKCRRFLVKDSSECEQHLGSAFEAVRSAAVAYVEDERDFALYPARYLIEIALSLSKAERFGIDAQATLKSVFRATASKMELLDAALNSVSSTMIDRLNAYNTLLYDAVLTNKPDVVNSSYEQLCETLSEHQLDIENLPRNMLHTVMLAKRDEAGQLSDADRTLFSGLLSFDHYRPWHVTLSDKKSTKRELDQMLA